MSTLSVATKRKTRGIAALGNIQKLRLLVQAGFVAFIAYTVALNVRVGESGTIIVASGEAFCPMGGFEALYAFITSGGSKLLSHTHLSNVVLFVGLMTSTLLFRGAFCGWICPFGALQEWTYRLSGWLQKRIPGLAAGVKAIKSRVNPKPVVVVGQPATPSLGQRLDHWLRFLKYGLLAWIIWGTVTYGVMVFRDIDPWATLVNFTEELAVGGIIVLVAVIVASFFVERAWCRYACPLGAIVGIASKVSPVRIQREGSACSGCSLCDRKCPVGIPISTVGDVTDPTCNMCLRCVDSCPKPGALELKLVLPGVKA
jgi:polyferredoxin